MLKGMVYIIERVLFKPYGTNSPVYQRLLPGTDEIG